MKMTKRCSNKNELVLLSCACICEYHVGEYFMFSRFCQPLSVFVSYCLNNATIINVEDFTEKKNIWPPKRVETRSNWLNCALWDDEVVYWVSIGRYEAVAVGNWWYWVSRGHLSLYILHKVEIRTGVTDAWWTDRLWKIELLSSL